MDQDRFEAEVIAIAHEGTALTVANVAARTRMAPRKVEAMLDAMLRGGHLDSDIDETEGMIVYRVKGLTAKPRARVAVDSAIDDVHKNMMRSAGEVLVRQAGARAKAAVLTPPKKGEKSILYGALFGLLGPLGLAYAAPWMTVLISVVVYAIYCAMVKIPVLGYLLAYGVPLIHLACVFAGAAYAHRFNKFGKRMPLLPPEKTGGIEI